MRLGWWKRSLHGRNYSRASYPAKQKRGRIGFMLRTRRRRLESRALILFIRLHALILISCSWSVLSSLFDGGVNSEEQVSREVLPVVQVRQVLNKLLNMPNIGYIFVFVFIWVSVHSSHVWTLSYPNRYLLHSPRPPPPPRATDAVTA